MSFGNILYIWIFGNCEYERGPLPWLGLHTHAAAMVLHGSLDNGQSHARSSIFFRAMKAFKYIKYFFMVAEINAYPFVFDKKLMV